MAEDDDGQQTGDGFVGSLERIIEGGLLRVFTAKPVQLAISRLITGIAEVPTAALEIPTAYLRRITEGIKADTAAKAAISAVIVKDAKLLALSDKSLTIRALDRWTAGIIKKQRNTEDVAARTVEMLAEDEVPADAAAPTEEFMAPFSDIAENASSKEIVDLMARILAGEIRKPGTISLRTLQTVAALDQKSVLTFSNCLPYLIEGNWFQLPLEDRTEWRRQFWILSNVGITNESGIRALRHDRDGRGAMRVGQHGIVYTCKPSMAGLWHIDGANLTMVGTELLTVFPKTSDPKVREIAAVLKSQDFIIKVEIGNLVITDDEWSVSDRVEI